MHTDNYLFFPQDVDGAITSTYNIIAQDMGKYYCTIAARGLNKLYVSASISDIKRIQQAQTDLAAYYDGIPSRPTNTNTSSPKKLPTKRSR
jgi:hypothetical protein